MGALNLTDRPYLALDGNSRALTPDLYHHPLRLDNQISFHPRQDLSYHNFPVNRINNSLQFSRITRNRELTWTTHTSTKLNCKLTMKIFGVNSHTIPTSTQIKRWTVSSPFVVTSLHLTSTEEPPFDHQRGSISFYNLSLVRNTEQLSETYDLILSKISASILCNNKCFITADCWRNHFWKITSTWWSSDHSTPSHSMWLF